MFLIVYVSLLVLMNLNIGPHADPKIDNWGHLGGFITGIFANIAIQENLDKDARNKERTPDRFTEEQYKNRCGCCKTWLCHYFGTFLLFAWLTALVVYFYAFIDMDDYEMEDINA